MVERLREEFSPGELTNCLQPNVELREISGILAVVSYTADSLDDTAPLAPAQLVQQRKVLNVAT
jgi:hypothetical protein